MGSVDDNTVVKVVIYTIAVMYMVLMRCCCEMLGMVIALTESSSVHVCSSCKFGAGFWQVPLKRLRSILSKSHDANKNRKSPDGNCSFVLQFAVSAFEW